MGERDPHDRTEILTRRAREGDREAFERLVARYRERLETFVHVRLRAHYLHRRLDDSDILQEALARALRSIERFEWRGENAFLRWLRGIAERVVLEEARRLKRDTMLKLAREPAASGPSPSTALRREERFDRLQGALDHLGAEYREVITLARIEGLRIEEIAERMDRSPAAVGKLLSRALKKLRRTFGETESYRLPGRRLEGGTGDGE